jgi:hypothetical protein
MTKIVFDRVLTKTRFFFVKFDLEPHETFVMLRFRFPW